MESAPAEYLISREALAPLLQTFWGPQGWRREGGILTDVPEQGIKAGLMFAEPRHLDHDGWVRAACEARDAVEQQEVGDAFVASLTSRRLDLRSALGSFTFLQHFHQHTFEPSPHGGRCVVCGNYPDSGPRDMNVLNFQRFKWGGVHHADLEYATFDLEMFARAPRLVPRPEDLALGSEVIHRLRTAEATTSVTKMATELKVLKGNAAERRVLLEILGICGVLVHPDHPGFNERFIPYAERLDVPGHWADTEYPAVWWRGRHGVDQDALREALPALA